MLLLPFTPSTISTSENVIRSMLFRLMLPSVRHTPRLRAAVWGAVTRDTPHLRLLPLEFPIPLNKGNNLRDQLKLCWLNSHNISEVISVVINISYVIAGNLYYYGIHHRSVTPVLCGRNCCGRLVGVGSISCPTRGLAGSSSPLSCPSTCLA